MIYNNLNITSIIYNNKHINNIIYNSKKFNLQKDVIKSITVINDSILIKLNILETVDEFGFYYGINIEDNKITFNGNREIWLSDILINETYYIKGYYIKNGNIEYNEIKNFKINSVYNLYTIDLELPSGTLWSFYNLGNVTTPVKGNYYAWGEITPKETYSLDNSFTYNKLNSKLLNQGIIDENNNLTSLYDAATMNWGKKWKMPTKEQLQELIDFCTWEEYTYDDEEVFKVTGPNGKYIIFPKNGYSLDNIILLNNKAGACWSSTVINTIDAYDLFFSSVYKTLDPGDKYYGMNIKPVLKNDNLKLPVLTPLKITNTNINYTNITFSYSIISDGGGNVKHYYFISTSPNPTIDDEQSYSWEYTLGNFNKTIKYLKTNTTYYIRIIARNELGYIYSNEIEFTTQDYQYVDLGLSVKWATCNVGANSPEDYGDYFAWGETETKTEYTDGNSLTYGLTETLLQTQGIIDENDDLTSQYDAATANWGGNWRMPTRAEQQELIDNCSWEWTTQNSVNGYKVTGPNGNSIFLPAAGIRYGSRIYGVGEYGHYFSSTSYGNYYTHDLRFLSSIYYMRYDDKYDGCSIRPVSE